MGQKLIQLNLKSYFNEKLQPKAWENVAMIKIPIGVTRNPRPKREKSQLLCVQETLQEVTVDSEPNEATNRQDYSQLSASECVLSFSGSTTVTVIQPFTSNHRPKELWEIPNQRLNWIEVFTRHVQIDTCRSGGVKTGTRALPAPQQSQASLLTHPRCPAAYPHIWCPGNVQQSAKWSVEIHPHLDDSTSLLLLHRRANSFNQRL